MVAFLFEYTCNGFVVAGSKESTPIDSLRNLGSGDSSLGLRGTFTILGVSPYKEE